MGGSKSGKFKAGISLLDFLLPRACCSCGKILSAEEKFLCSSCASGIEKTDDENLASEYERKFSVDNLIADFYAPLLFIKGTPIQDLIHELKYKSKFGVGIYLGNLVGKYGKERITGWHAQVIVPIPLHGLKKASRGYNQSYYLAKGVAEIIPIKIKEIIKRKKFTVSQTTLSHKERQANVSGAFKIKRFADVKGKRIILIDDVITTGSTVSEAAKALKENGASEIFALSVCLAQFSPENV